MTKIAGMVFRARDRVRTARFYSDLGLQENEHQHGGPVHHELGPMSENAVVEIYQSSATFTTDALMIEVPSIERALEIIATYDIVPEIEPRQASDIWFCYVQDPDDRLLMLIEYKK